MNVKLFDIDVEVIPCGICALLIPHSDSEENLTLQQSLDKLPKHQLALFASVQSVEWAASSETPRDDSSQTVKERMAEIHDRFNRATQERLWREVYMETNRRRRKCQRATS